MGLTISYKIWTNRRLTLAAVRGLAAALRRKTLKIGFEEVSDLIEVGLDFPGAWHIPHSAKTAADVLPPAGGWLFSAQPGIGAESLFMGLCRYENVSGWRLRGFCKTQYASCHGWEHFLKCHRRVIKLLRAAESLGLHLQVKDEGHLWETGSTARLRHTLELYDQSIAAFSGALKDAAGTMNVESQIQNHPRFEHLEASGMASLGKQIETAVEMVKQIAGESAA